jgi:uncharacterized protein YndB with AHSA1/START domain
MDSGQIRKQVLLHASRTRVWNALTRAKEFGSWFGMRLDGDFVAGQTIRGQIVPTSVDPEVAKMQKPYEGKAVELFVDRIDPEKTFCLKWHPFAIDPQVDYSREPMTLITFALEEKADGTQLTITETGFEAIPASRRAAALKANDGGWAHQAVLLRKYLELVPGTIAKT